MKIENNIPLPERKENASKWKEPISEMKVGDSFSCGSYEPKRSQNIASSIRNYVKNTDYSNYRFSVRKDDNNEIRVWRIK